jgi:hypothetical protein
VKGLGPDSAACIRTYKRLAREEDPANVKEFLSGLIREQKNKFLLLIITSGISRIRNLDRELDILDYLYRSKKLATHLRIYANTRCCYNICDSRNRALAKMFIQRGYESLHLRWSCPPSDRSKWDPTHIGFSVMLGMLHVFLVYGWLRRARPFSRAALGAASSIRESSITKSFYGTTTRIARIVGIHFLLAIQDGQLLEYGNECQSVLREVFANGMLVADGSLTRHLEYTESLAIYQAILQRLDGEYDDESLAQKMINLCILSRGRAKRRVLRKLGYAVLPPGNV